MKRKGHVFRTKPPWGHVPAVNLQGCTSPCHLPTPLPSDFFVVWQLQEYQGASGTAAYVVSSPGFVDPPARCPALITPSEAATSGSDLVTSESQAPPKKTGSWCNISTKLGFVYLLYILFEENTFKCTKSASPNPTKKKRHQKFLVEISSSYHHHFAHFSFEIDGFLCRKRTSNGPGSRPPHHAPLRDRAKRTFRDLVTPLDRERCVMFFLWNKMTIWLVVSTHLKNSSQNGNLPQVGMKINNI